MIGAGNARHAKTGFFSLANCPGIGWVDMVKIAQKDPPKIVDGKIKAKKITIKNRHPLLYPGRPKLVPALVDKAQAGDEQAYKEVGAYFYEDCVFMGKFAQRVYFIDPYDVANDAFLFYPNILRNYKPKSSFRYYYIIWLWKSLLLSLKKHMSLDIPFGGIESFDATPDVKNKKIWGHPYRKDGFEMEQPMVIEADDERFCFNPMTDEHLDKLRANAELREKISNVIETMSPKTKKMLRIFLECPDMTLKEYIEAEGGKYRANLAVKRRGEKIFRKTWLELYGAPYEAGSKKKENK